MPPGLRAHPPSPISQLAAIACSGVGYMFLERSDKFFLGRVSSVIAHGCFGRADDDRYCCILGQCLRLECPINCW